MDGWTDSWMDEWIDEWMNGEMGGWTDFNEWTNENTDLTKVSKVTI